MENERRDEEFTMVLNRWHMPYRRGAQCAPTVSYTHLFVPFKVTEPLNCPSTSETALHSQNMESQRAMGMLLFIISTSLPL